MKNDIKLKVGIATVITTRDQIEEIISKIIKSDFNREVLFTVDKQDGLWVHHVNEHLITREPDIYCKHHRWDYEDMSEFSMFSIGGMETSKILPTRIDATNIDSCRQNYTVEQLVEVLNND